MRSTSILIGFITGVSVGFELLEDELGTYLTIDLFLIRFLVSLSSKE